MPHQSFSPQWRLGQTSTVVMSEKGEELVECQIKAQVTEDLDKIYSCVTDNM